MTTNVLSWSVALDKGFEPSEYPYAFDKVAFGEYEAILDFKIWAKKVMGICCYFTQVASGKKFQLTVYCKGRTGAYKIGNCDIDFTSCPIGTAYRIKVGADQRKKIVFENAILV